MKDPWKDLPFEANIVTLEEWAQYLDNPIQRNTEKRAKKATAYLSTPHPSHYVVFAGECNSKKYKIDGHTRAYLWGREDIPCPPHGLLAITFQCKSKDDLETLYRTFDSPLATDRTTDYLAGAFRRIGFQPESSFFQKGLGTTPIIIAEHARSGKNYHDVIAKDKSNMVSVVQEWKNELETIDIIFLNAASISNYASSGIVAAMMLTIRKRQSSVHEFWEQYFNPLSQMMVSNPVNKLRAYHETKKRERQLSTMYTAIDLCAKAVTCAERWLANDPFDPKGPDGKRHDHLHPTKIRSYLD